MKQIHGVAQVKKATMMNSDATQDVFVTDAGLHVALALSSSSYAARLTPEEARFIATSLNEAADRAERSEDK